ncbi:MAG: sialate O-acetylesterase [Verrucomicrobiales bacterium]
MMRPVLLFTFLSHAILPQVSAAKLRLPNIFGESMVLQRDKPVALWGWATPDAQVTVSFAGQSKSAATAKDGTWSLKLDPMPAAAQPRSLRVSSGGENLNIGNILVGEVWICGGQSNMEWTLRGSRDADLELTAADFPAIRFIRLPKVARISPQDDFPVETPVNPVGNWHSAVSGQVENCTAVGYYFARRLHRQLKVPVGIIDNSWGGTRAQHWCSKKTLATIPEMAPDLEKFTSAHKAWIDGGHAAGAEERLAKALADWEKQRQQAKAKGEREPRRPNANNYRDPANSGQPGGMFNGSLMPVAKTTIRGALFYQGENNSFTTAWKPFHRTFPAVIADWRAAFNEPGLPFGIIQIAGWSNRRSMAYDMNHHCNIVREIQADTWRDIQNTGLIVTYDTNSNGSIHPGRKLPVGGRAARWALAEVYGTKQAGSDKPLEWRGPLFEAATFGNNKAFVTFQGGTDRGLRLDQDVDVGFVLAGKDRVFHHARARISQRKTDKRQQVELWCDEVSEPVAVRYAFSNLPMGGLMNARELPAYPFRSDDWPMTPHQSTGSYQRQARQ